MTINADVAKAQHAHIIADVRDVTEFAQSVLENAIDAPTFRTLIGAGTGEGGTGVWGDITGILSDQTDLQSALASKYTKPGTGIPKADLASAVQTSLGKADAAYAKPADGIPETDLAAAVQTSLDNADAAYAKPTDGIPRADLASDVQDSLGKADSQQAALSTKADLVGSHVPIDQAPAGTTITVVSTTSWPLRPTSRTDVFVIWLDLGALGTQPAGAIDGDQLIAAS